MVPDDAFVALRPPVLGHAVEHDAERDVYRLVDEEGVEHARGSLEACEDALVARLTERHGRGHPNLPMPTLGARQFWGDLFWHAGWRIQENVLTGHHRLLDPEDTRRAWGSYEACRTVFEEHRRDLDPASPAEHLVVLLHGLGRHKDVWNDMAAALRAEGLDVAALSYPSTRRSIAAHAEQVGTLLDRLEGVRRVSFVTHSLGGLVARATLAAHGPWRDRIEAHAVVMLSPPSQGSELARALADTLPFALLAGESALDIARLEALELPAPDVPFGVVRAGRGDDSGYNPWIEGDDDGVVAVSEMALEGAADETFVRGLHTFVMRDPLVIAATARFLREQRFDADGEGATRDG